MSAAQPPGGASRQALLAEVQTLRQRVAALEQEKHDLEVMLEMATDHADDLSEVLQQERDDLETMLEMTTDHADALEADLQSQAEALERRGQFIRETFGRYISEEVVAQLLDAPEGLELGGVKRKVAALKRWCKAQPFPTVCLHQNTRSRGGPGEPVTLMSVAFGGEQEATMIVGVRRKKDSQELDEWARNAHEKTITLHVVKNKRPPGRCTPRDGVDLYMEPLTGVIRMLRDEDWPSPPKAISRVGEAVQAVSNGG